MKEDPIHNPYTFDPFEDEDKLTERFVRSGHEPHPRDLESAIGRFLGFLFGLGIAITICGIISIISA